MTKESRELQLQSVLNKVYSGYTAAERYFNTSAAILIVALMLMVVSDVIGRYVFNNPLTGTLEVTELFVVGIVYAALAYTQFLKAHISVDLLVIHYGPGKRLTAETITLLILLAFFALLVWQGSRMAWDSWQIREISVGPPIPIYPGKVIVPIGSFLICIRLIIQIAENLKALLIGGIRT